MNAWLSSRSWCLGENMGYWRCLKCNLMTGLPEHHAKVRGDHEPEWEHCTCGSGAHPRRCKLHPDEYDRHVAELNAEEE